MNEAHFHLLTNHFPIIAPILGLLILIVAFLVKSEVMKRTAYFVFIIGAISTVPAYMSGEGAEEVLEHMGASHRLIHEHEEHAETFALLSYVLGMLAALSLVASWKKMRFAKISSFVVLLFSIAVIYTGRQAGASGGEIKHDEIRNSALSNEDQRQEPGQDHDLDDDDDDSDDN